MAQRWPGGLDDFLARLPAKRRLDDGHLLAFTLPDQDAIDRVFARLERGGLATQRDRELVDVAIVDQRRGPLGWCRSRGGRRRHPADAPHQRAPHQLQRQRLSPAQRLVPRDDQPGQLALSLFSPAENQSAVMVKQASGSSSDVSFELKLNLAVVPAGPWLRVVYPNGGEQLAPGSTAEIRWTTGRAIPRIAPAWPADTGATWLSVETAVPNQERWSWTVPELATGGALIRVADSEVPATLDASDATFAIGAAPVTRVAVLFGSSWMFHDRGVELGSG